LLRGIPTSRSDTGYRQRRRLHEAGLTVLDLPVLCDVDTAVDAWTVAEKCPATAFARLLRDFDQAGAA
jgi:hypothetical protein